MLLQSAALLLVSVLGAESVPMGHARHLLVYDPSGMHLAILLMAFTALIIFCFLFRGTFMPMKYKKVVEDRDIFFVDHWTNLCKHNKLGTECAECRAGDSYQTARPQGEGQRGGSPQPSGQRQQAQPNSQKTNYM